MNSAEFHQFYEINDLYSFVKGKVSVTLLQLYFFLVQYVKCRGFCLRCCISCFRTYAGFVMDIFNMCYYSIT